MHQTDLQIYINVFKTCLHLDPWWPDSIFISACPCVWQQSSSFCHLQPEQDLCSIQVRLQPKSPWLQCSLLWRWVSSPLVSILTQIHQLSKDLRLYWTCVSAHSYNDKGRQISFSFFWISTLRNTIVLTYWVKMSFLVLFNSLWSNDYSRCWRWGNCNPPVSSSIPPEPELQLDHQSTGTM